MDGCPFCIHDVMRAGKDKDMIYDKIENIGTYKGISKWFDIAADFLLQTDLESLPPGRTFICGEHVFANVMEADTVDEAAVSFEIHKKYWDIQIDMEGTEEVLIGLEKEYVVEEFRTDIDFGTFACKEHIRCVMGPGRFIICMQEEPHKPTLTHGECHRVKKCVIKVEVEEDE